MYCGRCGHKMEENEKFCANCGAPKEGINDFNYVSTNNYDSNNVENNNKKTSGMKVASIVLGVLSILLPVSLIIGIVGLVLAIKSNKKEKNTIGIVLNAIGIALKVLLYILVILIVVFSVSFFDIYSGSNEDYNNSSIYDYDREYDDYFDDYYDDYDDKFDDYDFDDYSKYFEDFFEKYLNGNQKEENNSKHENA